VSVKTKHSQLNKINAIDICFFSLLHETILPTVMRARCIISQFRVNHMGAEAQKPSRCWLLCFVHSLFDEFQALRKGIRCVSFYLGLIVLGNFHLLRKHEINKWFVDNGKATFGFRLGYVSKCSTTWAQQSVLYMRTSKQSQRHT
jgi:hypothetical protein